LCVFFVRQASNPGAEAASPRTYQKGTVNATWLRKSPATSSFTLTGDAIPVPRPPLEEKALGQDVEEDRRQQLPVSQASRIPEV
jgi:hypothetical protein